MKLQSDGGWSLRLFHTLVWHLVEKYSNSWVLEMLVHLGYLSSCLPTCWLQSSRTSLVEFESSQRDCTKRDGQKLLVFSNLVSVVVQHHFCVVCRGSHKKMLRVKGRRQTAPLYRKKSKNLQACFKTTSSIMVATEVMYWDRYHLKKQDVRENEFYFVVTEFALLVQNPG